MQHAPRAGTPVDAAKRNHLIAQYARRTPFIERVRAYTDIPEDLFEALRITAAK